MPRGTAPRTKNKAKTRANLKKATRAVRKAMGREGAARKIAAKETKVYNKKQKLKKKKKAPRRGA